MSTIYRPSQFAARIGVSIKTLHRWDASGKLKAKRRPSGHRYYDESDVRKIFGGNPVKRKVVVYCRVSSAGQKDDVFMPPVRLAEVRDQAEGRIFGIQDG